MDISIDKFNESVLNIHFSEDGIGRELSEHFKFRVPNYKHMPKYKMGIWDGYIRLYNYETHELPSGLIHHLLMFARRENYTVDIDPDIRLADSSYVEPNLNPLFDSFNLPFTPHDYQVDAVRVILKHRKRLILSPTSSGKSLIIYSAIRAILGDLERPRGRILIVVPTTSLVEQMVGDFADYSEDNAFDADELCHKIYSGRSKTTDKPITVTTWQSVYKKKENWFKDYDAVFVDEAHLASSESITSIMNKCINAKFRIGLTGTIQDSKCHELVLTGVFGRVYETISTKELMDRGLVTQLKIKPVIFKHDDRDCKLVSSLSYADEIDYIINDPVKNNFIANLAINQTGNTLVLFNFVERHGKPLFELIKSKTDKSVFYVDGDTPVTERENIRKYTESHDDVIIVASYGTFSTGINIKNLENVIFAHPFKSKIKILQSIGRILRKGGSSDNATLYDIVSDYKYKSVKNTTLKHYHDRLKLYKAAKFNVHETEISYVD